MKFGSIRLGEYRIQWTNIKREHNQKAEQPMLHKSKHHAAHCNMMKHKRKQWTYIECNGINHRSRCCTTTPATASSAALPCGSLGEGPGCPRAACGSLPPGPRLFSAKSARLSVARRPRCPRSQVHQRSVSSSVRPVLGRRAWGVPGWQGQGQQGWLLEPWVVASGGNFRLESG